LLYNGLLFLLPRVQQFGGHISGIDDYTAKWLAEVGQKSAIRGPEIEAGERVALLSPSEIWDRW
jgi:hypothetical protein